LFFHENPQRNWEKEFSKISTSKINRFLTQEKEFNLANGTRSWWVQQTTIQRTGNSLSHPIFNQFDLPKDLKKNKSEIW